MKSTSAPGGAQLQALPLQLFERLVQVLNLVEETGTRPTPHSKGEGSALRDGLSVQTEGLPSESRHGALAGEMG